MIWEKCKCVIIALSLTTCINTQPTKSLPRKELLKKRVKAAKIVCLDWSGKLTEKDLEVLRRFKKNDRKKREWYPKLLLLFRIEGYRANSEKWFDLVRGLSVADGRCFMGEIYPINSPDWITASIFWRYDAPVDRLLCGSAKYSAAISGCIFPEALLQNSDVSVDIIFPPVDMLRTWSQLPSSGKTVKSAKKVLADYCGWKEDKPIKLGIVFMQRENELRRTLGEIYWLDLLFKTENCDHWFLSANTLLQAGSGDDEDTALVLFGGDAMLLDLFDLCHQGSSAIKEMEQRKADVIDRWPYDLQKIAFLFPCGHVYEAEKKFRYVFGNDMQLIVLSRATTETANWHLSYAIIGFPRS